jgi:HD-like signal output (HDOD) protein
MQNNDMMQAMRAAGVKIPACPQVLIDVQEILQDPDSGNQSLVRIIGRDIKLAAMVFKTANSAAASGGAKKFVDLDQAVAVLGRRTIANITRMAALQLSLAGPDPRLVRFWDRSMNVAMLCSIVAEIAPNGGQLSGEQAFTAGLFHDCGVAVLMQHFQSYCQAYAEPKKPLPEILEQDKAHTTSHCVVGQMVAQEWQLPDFVCETIAHHHGPLADVPPAGLAASAALLMSMHIANLKDKVDDAAWPPQRAAVIAQLGIAGDALDAFEKQVWDSFQVLH